MKKGCPDWQPFFISVFLLMRINEDIFAGIGHRADPLQMVLILANQIQLALFPVSERNLRYLDFYLIELIGPQKGAQAATGQFGVRRRAHNY